MPRTSEPGFTPGEPRAMDLSTAFPAIQRAPVLVNGANSGDRSLG